MPACVRKSILTILLCCYCTLGLIAQNLVPNASFEDVNICTEYTAPCAPSAWLSVAPEVARMKYLCNGAALQGQHYVNLLQEGKENPDLRVYIQTRLLCPLEKGRTYKIRIYMNTDNYPLRAGIRFDTAFVFTQSGSCLKAPASLELSENDVQKKLFRLNHPWYMLEKTYVATNNATHLLIGNFRAPQRKEGAGGGYSNAQLLIDSISVTPEGGPPFCPDADSTIALLYTEHHRHTIPEKLIASGDLIHRLDGTSGCDTIILKDDLFTVDKNSLNDRYKQQIDEALNRYKGNRARIQLIGYAWQKASEEYNRIISADKAKAVANYLVYNEGYSFDDFEVQGAGKTKPRYDTAGNTAGENNRVEMIICRPPLAKDTMRPRPVVHQPDTLVIPDILFKFNSSELNKNLYSSLDSLIKRIPRDGSIQLQVNGHTDNAGTSAYNNSLSMKRANAVAGYMQEHGLGNDIRLITGVGESQPVADNQSAAGRRRNRRVEIIIFYSPD
ncbi:OmpA family protein [Chitinophaga pinensis]|uniref:OmpA/MotB domain protein n=1 Tax=Chitinophaga pinensis (strain ATCC 43595 / DSM 2588 / LMG 13176 / NBRC 15968 / NCIMB 11800 / UQM 2034) TaxID=485918 RepID=A0A979G647_CHIPD|nr:OmpA family protein [Chitinophaga pinensis]ACU61420.1 OmpA/MotB domain protein [Chitinophaga pinensis DSM 2588]